MPGKLTLRFPETKKVNDDAFIRACGQIVFLALGLMIISFICKDWLHKEIDLNLLTWVGTFILLMDNYKSGYRRGLETKRFDA